MAIHSVRAAMNLIQAPGRDSLSSPIQSFGHAWEFLDEPVLNFLLAPRKRFALQSAKQHRRGQMLRSIMLAATALVLATSANADISGTWLTEDKGEGQLVVKISRCGDEYCGTILDMINTANKNAIGVQMIKEMKDKGEGNYADGQILHPGEGKWYKSKIEEKADGTLGVSGCVWLFCREQIWTRR